MMSVKYLTLGEFVAVIKIYTFVALSKFCRHGWLRDIGEIQKKMYCGIP